MKDIYIVVGLGFGDEGKGNTVNYLARKYDARMAVRFNGGPQAAHFVTLDNGTSHCCSQFTSISPLGWLSYLSHYMLVEPFALMEEAEALASHVNFGNFNPYDAIRIHPDCPVVTPYHRLIGQMVEISKSKDSKHGSVGLGVGQAVFDYQKKGPTDALIFRDFQTFDEALRKISTLKGETIERAEEIVLMDPTNERLVRRRDEIKNRNSLELTEEYLDCLDSISSPIMDPNGMLFPRCLRWDTPTIFEGAQGALLDFNGGFWPHVTKSCTTTNNALLLIEHEEEASPFPQGLNIVQMGVLRAYDHRHGPGPFPTENEILRKFLLEYDNAKNEWQGPFRVGWFDIVMAKYALALNQGKINELVITNIDKLSLIPTIPICEYYEYVGPFSTLLKEFFVLEYQRSSDQLFITGIIEKERSEAERQLLTDLLADCKPVYSIECKGWLSNLANVTKYVDFPDALKNYIDTLEWHLDVPITVVSKGESWKDKVER